MLYVFTFMCLAVVDSAQRGWDGLMTCFTWAFTCFAIVDGLLMISWWSCLASLSYQLIEVWVNTCAEGVLLLVP
ncbi:hypothetical protein BJ165DRAFT_1458528 [Panaeolus papilionaceus]|nr:hypothetical protein BJ165DRAFT_1458528 [Panaeolus papilionaceus]